MHPFWPRSALRLTAEPVRMKLRFDFDDRIAKAGEAQHRYRASPAFCGIVNLAYLPASGEPREWHEADLSTWWIPDAFIGPMASLMEAIQIGDEPITAGADNLGTLRTVFAAYRSAAEGRFVALTEIA